MPKDLMPSKELYDWLVRGGVFTPEQRVRRVIIDIAAGKALRILVEQVGEKELTDPSVPPDLLAAGVEVQPAHDMPEYPL